MRTRDIAVLLYGLALKLYPAPFQAEFGEEMSEVFGRAVLDAASGGRWTLPELLLREMTGIVVGSARERTTRAALAAAVRGHAAPLTAGLAVAGVFFLGMLFAGGTFIFQPLLYLFVMVALMLGSIEAGRLQVEGRPSGQRLFRTGLALFLVMVAVPAARLVDHAWLGHLARFGGGLEHVLPGIDVRAMPVAVLSDPGAGSIPWDDVLPEDRSGFIHSDSRPAMAGTVVLRLMRSPMRVLGKPISLLVLLSVAAFLVMVIALRPAAQIEPRLALEDFQRLKRHLSEAWANMEWIAGHRGVDLREANAVTADALAGVTSTGEAREISIDFVRSFRDPTSTPGRCSPPCSGSC